MTRWGPHLTVSVALLAGISAFCSAQDAPATQPTARGGLLNPINLVQRLENRVDELRSTPQQQTRLANMFQTAMRQAEILQNQLRNAAETERLQRVLPFMRDLRRELMTVLTQQQAAQLWGEPATRPGFRQPDFLLPNAQGPGRGGRGGRGGLAGPGAFAGPMMLVLNRINDAIPQLNLPAEENAQVSTLMSQTMKQAQEIRQRMAAGENVQDAARMLVTNFRDKLFAILTPQQRQDLRQLVLADDPATRPASPRSNVPGDKQEMVPDAAPAQAPASSAPDATAPATAEAKSFVPVGSMAPTFALSTPGSVIVSSDKFQGRVLVLDFGSVTSPTFREHLEAMEKLSQKYTDRAVFLIVYTREVHPSGGWEVNRNQADGFTAPQPADYAARLAQAEKARRALNISLPMVVDKLDDEVTAEYGGFPNAAIVIGRDGKIAGRQQWADPSGLARLIDAALQ
jgi:Spy/CpxP family protein refolding chaperone